MTAARTEPSTTERVRRRIANSGERIWRFCDFEDLPFAAVAQALSRLVRAGRLRRLSKGVYYHPRQTPFGESLPNPAKLQLLAAERAPVFPAGLGAANLLGFTTQVARHTEVATTATSLPRALVGSDTIVHTRRPSAWKRLGQQDAALLDLLRHSGHTSELPPEETTRRTLTILAADGRLAALLRAAATEPPRVRALLGALAEAIGAEPGALSRLRRGLNPFSRFDFGAFAGLSTARAWQAKPGAAS